MIYLLAALYLIVSGFYAMAGWYEAHGVCGCQRDHEEAAEFTWGVTRGDRLRCAAAFAVLGPINLFLRQFAEPNPVQDLLNSVRLREYRWLWDIYDT